MSFLSKVLIFILLNIGIGIIDIILFQSAIPWLGWASVIIHLIVMIEFPYSNFFKPKSNK